MPTPTRPSTYLNWVLSGNPSYIQQPTTGQSTTGYVSLEAVPFQYLNYQFYLLDQWTQWLDYITQSDTLSATTTILVTTGNTTVNSNQLTGLAATTNVLAGHAIVGTSIATGTVVVEISGTTVTMSRPATATLTGTSVTFEHEYATGSTTQAQLDELDAAASRNRPYDLVVGSGAQCDYATLNALIADTTIGPGKRVLLIESQTISTTPNFTQNFWTLTGLPGVALTQGGSATVGINFEAQGLTVENIRFVNFSDAGIAFNSSGKYCRVKNCNFNNCGTSLDTSSAPTGNLFPVEEGSIVE